MRESALVAKIKKALEAEGAKVLKVHGSALTEAGTPDLVGCYQGKCFALEVKRDEKHKPTALQLLRLVQWREAGAKGAVVWTVEMALEVMKAQLWRCEECGQPLEDRVADKTKPYCEECGQPL